MEHCALVCCTDSYGSSVAVKEVEAASDIDTVGWCDVTNLAESSSVVSVVRTSKGTEWAMLTSLP